MIFAELNAGNAAVKAVVDAWIEEIACGLASLIHTFNPSCIVMGGGIMNEPYIQEGLRAALASVAMGSFLKDLTLTRAKLGNKAGVLGAAKWAMELDVRR